LTVSSWDPRTEELTDWLARRIGEEYEFLRRSDEYGANAPQRLVREGSVLPILDGLDEIAQALRPVAIAAIDRAMAKGLPAVVTCRGDEFEAAVAEGSSFLSTTPVVEIQDVRPHEAKEFLVESTPNGYARWEPVLRELEANPNVPAAKALSTPLMLWLAREVYRA
jgi:predicted NACHT family NTPase